ncbi:germin-like protein 9-3 [Gossypium hirsutum]|uniref:Germin-like protein n=5 Tax=Gossypium TaxID=3633 RepID=A0A1U8IMJ6_GOSHI|nr:germin-like protein 9-3 [Gossypium hirsutum]
MLDSSTLFTLINNKKQNVTTKLLGISPINYSAGTTFPNFSNTASRISTMKLLSLVLSSFVIVQIALAGDPDILSDFLVPNQNNVDGSFFTYTGMRVLVNQSTFPANFTILKASMVEFPALNGQSVSYAVLQYPASSLNPPHTHPRAAELLFLVDGSLEVGFVDTTNKLFTQSLQAGDMFIFPKGLVHYQYNADPNNPAIAISSFGSANAGTVSLPKTLFATNIDDTILAKSFKTDVSTIQALKAGLA